jgi:hypothetical protein
MSNTLIDQATDEILTEFFSITNVPADKIEMVRNWMKPVIWACLVKCSTPNMMLQEVNQEPWKGQEPELIRASIDAQERQNKMN